MVSPRVEDEPRDEEEEERNRDYLDIFLLHLRLHHRILGDVVRPTKGGERTSPEDHGEDAEDGLHRDL